MGSNTLAETVDTMWRACAGVDPQHEQALLERSKRDQQRVTFFSNLLTFLKEYKTEYEKMKKQKQDEQKRMEAKKKAEARRVLKNTETKQVAFSETVNNFTAQSRQEFSNLRRSRDRIQTDSRRKILKSKEAIAS